MLRNIHFQKWNKDRYNLTVVLQDNSCFRFQFKRDLLSALQHLFTMSFSPEGGTFSGDVLSLVNIEKHWTKFRQSTQTFHVI